MVSDRTPVKDGDPFSTHKSRTSWFGERTTYPFRDVSPVALEQHWLRCRADSRDPGFRWESAGPFNVAGRVTSLAVHPQEHQTIYAGAAVAGVWKSTDGGRVWTTSWPQFISPNVGSLTIDPFHPEVIYCGTGEANLSGDSYPGSGVYVSRDAGATWSAAGDSSNLPRRIGVIAVCPFEKSGDTLYLGGVTHDASMPAGLYFSTNGGLNWQREDHFSTANYRCHSIVFHPDGLVFAAIHTRGVLSGIWRLSQGKWEQLRHGLPSGDRFGRVSLAVSPSRPDTIFALCADHLNKRVLGVFRSRNKGDRWQEISHGALKSQSQLSYNNTISVHPEDPDFVVCGATDLYITANSGANWRRASRWDLERDAPQYVHGDHHATAILHDNTIYTANDGGFAVSEDAGVNWETRDRGMVTTMFYDVEVARTNPERFGGGTQDNGTLITGIGNPPGDFMRVLAGDGAWTVIDPADHDHVFGSSQNITLSRHRGPGNWQRLFWKSVSPKKMPRDESRQAAIAVMVIHPSSRRKQKTIWVGSRRLWRTTNNGGSWKPVSPDFDGSTVSAIEVSGANPRRMYVGTTRGGIFRSLDGGETWSGNIAGPEMPARLITEIETHPKSADMVVVTVSGSGIAARDGERMFHIYCSRDGGSTWKSIDGPRIPDVPHHTVVFETSPPFRLFIGNDCGVWMSRDLQGWIDITSNLPTVTVSRLDYDRSSRWLTAATYGRGIWRLRIPDDLNFAVRESIKTG